MPPAVPTALQTALARVADSAGKEALPPSLAAALPAPAPPVPPPTRASRRASAAAHLAAARPARVPRPPATAPSPAAKPPRRSAPAPRRASQRITDLQELATVARQLREQHEREQAEEKARREAAARAEAEQQLFSRSVGPITPLRVRNLARLQRRLPQPLPLQHWLDEERVLLESISDDFDVSTLLDTDDALSYRRPGIGVQVTQRLRAGYWAIQGQLDLHGLRVDEAREALGQFIRQSHKSGLRCVRVVHGKGLGSPGKSPVLKGRVQRWLVQKNEVLAFVQARPVDGGAGALLVLLQPAGPRST